MIVVKMATDIRSNMHVYIYIHMYFAGLQLGKGSL